MINPRDKHDFARLREPSLEDLLPPAFLSGDRRRERPFEPIGHDSQLVERNLLRVSTIEIIGLAGFALAVGFILGYYCAFVR